LAYALRSDDIMSLVHFSILSEINILAARIVPDAGQNTHAGGQGLPGVATREAF